MKTGMGGGEAFARTSLTHHFRLNHHECFGEESAESTQVAWLEMASCPASSDDKE